MWSHYLPQENGSWKIRIGEVRTIAGRERRVVTEIVTDDVPRFVVELSQEFPEATQISFREERGDALVILPDSTTLYVR